ncbi:ribonuclease H-like domain-containing protein [Tanacetum coccineum]
MSGSQDEIPPPPPPPSSSQTPTQQTPHTVLPPRTAEEILARERERKARTTLLMALPEDHLAKFHKMTDAKEMWDAIKSRFGGNDESKKMQKYILKQQFKGFSVSNSEGLHKGYDRFQSLLSQLEIHGAGVSTEDANQKFLRSLPSAWSQVSLIMRTKPGVDSLSFDDLYNNLRVFENDVKGSTASSSSTQNVAFVSENTSSTNDVSTAYSVSNTSGQNSQYEQTSSYSLLANQSSCPQLDHEDLEQLDEFDLEEMDLKWQVAMISMRMKKFYKKTGRKLQFDAKEPVGFDKTKVECYNCHKTGHFARECRTKGNQDSRRRDAWNSGNKDGRRSGKQEDSKALVTIDGEGVDWTSHSEEEEDYALMACNSSGSDTEPQRETLSDASIEIKAYDSRSKESEATIVAHQQVSAVGGKRETAVKPSAGCNLEDPKEQLNNWNKSLPNYNGGIQSRNFFFTFKDPLGDSEKEDENLSGRDLSTAYMASYSSNTKRSTKDAVNLNKDVMEGNSEWKLQEENFNWKGWYCSNTFTSNCLQKFKLLKRKGRIKNTMLMADSQRTYEKISWNG